MLEQEGKWRQRAATARARGFAAVAVRAGETRGLDWRGLAGLAVWVLPAHDVTSADWCAAVVPAISSVQPRAVYLHPQNWGPAMDAQVVVSRGPQVDARGALPPDAPWGATWDWIDGREAFYDRLIDYCLGEEIEIPDWVKDGSARIARWKENEGLYGI